MTDNRTNRISEDIETGRYQYILDTDVQFFTARCCTRCTHCGKEPLYDHGTEWYRCNKTGAAIQPHYYCRHFEDWVTEGEERLRVQTIMDARHYDD